MSNNPKINVDLSHTVSEKMVRLHALFVFVASFVFGVMNIFTEDVAVGIGIIVVGAAAAAVALFTKERMKRITRGMILSLGQFLLIVAASVVRHEVHGMFPLLLASMIISAIYFNKLTLIIHWIGMDLVCLVGLAFRDFFYAGQEFVFLIKGLLGMNVGAFMLWYLVNVCINHLAEAQGARGEADKLLSQVKEQMQETETLASQEKEVVASIAAISSNVMISSDQMLEIAAHISSAAQEEMANIEEISKEINQMALQTEESLEESEKAAEVAAESTRLLNESNADVTQMVEAMEAIEEAASKIRTIVKTIEDIAFQTNILALNASVEAARAGEAGKGFAVVADEVRNLAGKSSDAVKNTTGLINESIDAVQRGRVLANDVMKGMGEVIVAAEQSAQHADLISRLNRSQANFVSDVKTHISQISEMVAQSTQSSEESSQIASSVADEAKRMDDIVSNFR